MEVIQSECSRDTLIVKVSKFHAETSLPVIGDTLSRSAQLSTEIAETFGTLWMFVIMVAEYSWCLFV